VWAVRGELLLEPDALLGRSQRLCLIFIPDGRYLYRDS
jgi:hypothetical protein